MGVVKVTAPAPVRRNRPSRKLYSPRPRAQPPPMPEGKFDREFLRGALALTGRSDVDRLLLVSDHPLSPAEVRGRPIKKHLAYAVTTEGLANQIKTKKY